LVILADHQWLDKRVRCVQGGIYGGTVMAIAQDITRGVLGVPGMNYSTLLERDRYIRDALAEFGYYLALRASSSPISSIEPRAVTRWQSPGTDAPWHAGRGQGHTHAPEARRAAGKDPGRQRLRRAAAERPAEALRRAWLAIPML
jgi:hypothetical protein